MGNKQTGIEWTDYTWNPVTGCNKVSAGCANCYAEAIANRFKGTRGFPNGFALTLKPNRLNDKFGPGIKKIFVNSMSDIFHEKIPISYIEQIFENIRKNPQHIFQILTKRHKRLVELAPSLTWHNNIWVGVSVESQQYVERIQSLKQVTAAVKFLSCEPLLGNLEMNLAGIDWVIVGGESGSTHHLIQSKWVEGIHEQCINYDVPFFFKQWGGSTPKKYGRTFQGKHWDEMPKAWYAHLEQYKHLIK